MSTAVHNRMKMMPRFRAREILSRQLPRILSPVVSTSKGVEVKDAANQDGGQDSALPEVVTIGRVRVRVAGPTGRPAKAVTVNIRSRWLWAEGQEEDEPRHVLLTSLATDRAGYAVARVERISSLTMAKSIHSSF